MRLADRFDRFDLFGGGTNSGGWGKEPVKEKHGQTEEPDAGRGKI